MRDHNKKSVNKKITKDKSAKKSTNKKVKINKSTSKMIKINKSNNSTYKKITKDSSAHNSTNKKIIINKTIINKINIVNDPIRKRKEVNLCDNINNTNTYTQKANQKEIKEIQSKYHTFYMQLKACVAKIKFFKGSGLHFYL